MPEVAVTLPLFLGALLAGITRGKLRAILMLAAPIVGAYLVYTLTPGQNFETTLFGKELTPVRVDSLSVLFGYLFHLAAFIGVVYSLHLKDTPQLVASLAYAACAVGAVFAGDLLALFLYWEGLAITSSILVFARRSGRSLGAGIRYLLVQVFSGVLLLAGTIAWAHGGNGLDFNHIGLESMAGKIIFVAFGIKASFPLMHNWLTDSYPEATPSGTVFLSAFTTKVAIYSLARGYAGTEQLIYIGVTMACFPIFYAVIANDLRRVLAYSLINQLGFMVVGIGIGTELALNGAVAHAFNDVLFKGLLMMSMGAVLHVTGEMRGSELGGLYKKMPKTAILCMIGAASISAFPLFNGFVSKSMIVTAVLEEGYEWVWLGLLFAAAGVFHHAGIKIPFFAFFGHNSKHIETAHEPPKNMLVAMTIAASLCIGIGCFPATLYSLLPYSTDYSPYDASHILSQMQLLAFSALAFLSLKLYKIYPPELRSTHLDAQWVYRRFAPTLIRQSFRFVMSVDQAFRKAVLKLMGRGVLGLARHHRSEGVLARSWPTGSMVFWVAVLLGSTLLMYYV
ncbi:MAG: Na(+)/H(+) antiporter subunit D [Planctomycetes bacterium]|nr:Na(+)/H(+) antiporter subunit D [Planctomycetota bacterium]MCP4771395.1 Na(+)/H(+) antiporter subunit D [Planctomycetota bacterium]MCP4861832.1 Na(+)/H(+) antiporter subunit D [Planctomycetota bacterium]